MAKPTCFVSHAWRYRFTDVVSALASMPHSGSLYFWYDIMTVDQNFNGAPPPAEWWDRTFRQAVSDIGLTALVFSPWENAIPLSRSWCLWEIYATIDSSVPLIITLPPGEKERFEGTLRTNFEEIQSVVATVDTRQADAFNKADRERIANAIDRSVGFDRVNTIVRQGLNKSLSDVVITLAKSNSTDFELQHCAARLHIEQGNFMLASEMALTLEELSSNSEEECWAQHTMGWVHIKLGQLQKAETHLLHAVKLGRNVLAQDSSFPVILDDLAHAYGCQGNIDKAKEVYSEALTLSKKLLPPSHPQIGMILNNMAQISHDSEAKDMYEEALRILMPGPEDHPHLATTLYNLALLHQRLGEYDIAENLLLKAEGIRMRTLPDHHVGIARSHKELALLYVKAGRPEEAMAKYKAALSIMRTSMPEVCPETAFVLSEMGLLCAEHLHEPLQAKQLQEEALAIRRKCDDEGDVANSLQWIAEVLLFFMDGCEAEAEPLLLEALQIRRQLFLSKGKPVATLLLFLTKVYIALDRPEDAVVFVSEAIGMKDIEMYGTYLASASRMRESINASSR